MQRDRLLIEEMIEAATRIIATVGDDGPDVVAGDRQRVDALLWNFTVLGEASRQLSDKIAVNHADVPWQRPIQLRNRIVHGYWSIDVSILVDTARTQLPEFVAQLRSVADNLGDDSG